jgi:hypothetical protein
MTVTIVLKPELEALLQTEAAKTGIDAGTFVIGAIEERLHRSGSKRVPPHLSREEADLLGRINRGLPEAVWQEYHALVQKRRAETLTAREHARLIALTDRIEEAHTARLTDAADLARLRGVPLKTLLRQLGLKPRAV